jgi:hypothetical protein
VFPLASTVSTPSAPVTEAPGVVRDRVRVVRVSVGVRIRVGVRVGVRVCRCSLTYSHSSWNIRRTG